MTLENDHTWRVGDIVRTATGTTDRIVTEVETEADWDARLARFGRTRETTTATRPPGTLITHRTLRHGRPFGAMRTNRATDLTLIRPAT